MRKTTVQGVSKNMNKFGKNSSAPNSDKSLTFISFDREKLNFDFDTLICKNQSKICLTES